MKTNPKHLELVELVLDKADCEYAKNAYGSYNYSVIYLWLDSEKFPKLKGIKIIGNAVFSNAFTAYIQEEESSRDFINIKLEIGRKDGNRLFKEANAKVLSTKKAKAEAEALRKSSILEESIKNTIEHYTDKQNN